MADYISRKLQVASRESVRAKVQSICERWLQPLDRTGGENPFQLRDRLERIMWTKVGVVRNGKDMTAALPEIQDVRERVKSASGSNGAIYNAKWNEAINTENLTVIAEMLTRSALAREESRGAHYRSDFPEKDVRWLRNICMQPLPDGDFKVSYLPVKFTRLTPEELKDWNKTLDSVSAVDDE